MNFKELSEHLKQKHLKTFEILNVKNPYFVPKIVFAKDGINYISMLDSELKVQGDIYIDLITSDFEPFDNHQLYLLKPIKNYKNVLKPSDTKGRYLVPIKMLNKVYNQEFDLFNQDENIKFADITVKDFIAILYKKPISDKSWLNDLIVKLKN